MIDISASHICQAAVRTAVVSRGRESWKIGEELLAPIVRYRWALWYRFAVQVRERDDAVGNRKTQGSMEQGLCEDVEEIVSRSGWCGGSTYLRL